MDQTTITDYRKRLLPFVEQWTGRNTRVAVFGTGPHTDFLFASVPELERVRIVGYLDSNKERRGKSYRGRKIHLPDWAGTNADVILCSSFVNEASMAAAVEHIACKILTSHTPPTDNRMGANPAEKRPASHLVIPWTESAEQRVDLISDPANMLLRYHHRAASFLSKVRILDSILDECFPFVRIPDTDIARVVLRYVLPGSWIFEIRADSPALTRLSLLCSGPGGKLFAVQPRYSLNPSSLGIDADAGDFASLNWAWMKGVENNESRVSSCRNLTLLHRRPCAGSNLWEDFNRAVTDFVAQRLRSTKSTCFIRIDDSAVSLKLLRSLKRSIEKHSPILLFKVDESRWGLASYEVFSVLASIGYKLMSLEECYRHVDALHYNSSLGFGLVHILAVRTGRGRQVEAK